MADQHLIMAEHTMPTGPRALPALAGRRPRQPREWLKAGGKDTYQRACDEVDARLARYRPLETDPAIDAELRRIIRSGLIDQTELPFIPPATEPTAEALAAGSGPARRRNARRAG